MIMSFADDESRKIFDGERSKKLPTEIQGKARAKLLILNAAVLVSDLRLPPSNKLEKLVGHVNRWSIRVNRQWRVCFVWRERNPEPSNGKETPGDAYDVEINNHYT